MNQDLHLLYAGGSGGHFCSHLILQSGLHTCVLNSTDDDHLTEENVEFSTAKQIQWDITDPELWKNKEYWPQNYQTLKLETDKNKFYMTCNPSPGPKDAKQYPATTVYLYIDADTHWELMKYKHANWFYLSASAKRDGLVIEDLQLRWMDRDWNEFYNNTRRPGWPDCDSILDIKNLPDGVLRTLDAQPYSDWVEHQDVTRLLKETRGKKEFNGTIVYDWEVYQSMTYADMHINLKDIIASQGKALTDLLDLPYTNEHTKLFEHWWNLHPDYLKNLLLEG